MRERVIEYLIDNRDYFIEKTSDLVDKRESEKKSLSYLFHEDIDEDFLEAVTERISGDITKATGADMESIMIVLEEMNLGEYLCAV
jgi:phenylpyruvate tautomerase PptA (4-oxalocrotonate tautomerase family)